jgi:hypothetical protein
MIVYHVRIRMQLCLVNEQSIFVFHRVYFLYKISYLFSAYIYVFQRITANTLLVTGRAVFIETYSVFPND